jgi:hypothetical protein
MDRGVASSFYGRQMFRWEERQGPTGDRPNQRRSGPPGQFLQEAVRKRENMAMFSNEVGRI